MKAFPKYIAEVSSNHAQDLNRILKFIDAAALTGCDAVKFQLFEVEKLFTQETIKAMPEVMERKKWELPLEFFPEIRKRCSERNMLLGCTPFHLEAVDDLLPFVDFYKVASYELLWLDLIRKCAQQSKPLIISTGMATMEEIRAANAAAKSTKNKNIAFLHCESSYPVKAEEANLAAISFLREELMCAVGWSDHSRDPAVVLRAAHTWNAEIFEFHLDLDSEGAEFGSGHCWLPDELTNVISLIERGKTADGIKAKFPGNSELSDRIWRADPSDGLRPMLEKRKNLTE